MGISKLIDNKVVSAVMNKQNFIMVYTALLMIRSVYFLQEYVDIFCKLCMFWGVLVLLYDLLKEKLSFFKIKGSFLPLILCVCYGLSVVVNYKYALYGGIKNMLYLVIYFYIIFAVKIENDKDSFLKFFVRNNNVFIAVNGIIAFASLFTFIFGINKAIIVDNNVYRIGFWFNRLSGVSTPNTATMAAMVSLVLIAVNLVILKGKCSKAGKVMYAVTAVVQFCYYALAGSRAATLCYLIVLVIATTFILFPHLRLKTTNFRAIALCVLAVLLVCSTVYGLEAGCQSVMRKGAELVSSATEDEEGGDADVEIDFERVEDFENGDITNRRGAMWKAALKAVYQNPVFGIAYPKIYLGEDSFIGSVDPSVFTEEDIVGLKSADFYFHNGYIQILLCGGVLFSVFFIIFAIKCVVPCIKHLFRVKLKNREYMAFVLVLAVVVALVVDNLVEVHLLFGGQDGLSTQFWYLLGVALSFANLKDGEKAEALEETNA